MTGRDERNDPIARYAAERGRMLEEVVRFLRGDPRFPAAWLTGSFGRGEDDPLSDVDLSVVVVDRARERLCARPWQVGAGTTAERLALVRSIGQPVVVHENHHNAPAGGSFTHVVYAGPGVGVDWTLVPQSEARRPPASRLLFDGAGIPLQAPARAESRDERAAAAAERVAFFWMVAFPAAKAALRRQPVEFHLLLDLLHGTMRDVERLVRGEPPRDRRRSGAPFATTYGAQAAAVRRLCGRLVELGPDLVALGATVPVPPVAAVDALLSVGPVGDPDGWEGD